MGVPGYGLRPARREESEALFAIHRAAMERYVAETWGAWDEAFQRPFWAESWPPGRQAILVDGELAGFLDLAERPGSIWVGNIEIHPRFQGLGTGSAILREVQRDASTRGLAFAIAAACTRPRAIETRCFMPPDNSCGCRLPKPSRPTSFRASSALARRSDLATPRSASGNSTFSSAVSQGNRLGS